MIEMTWIITRHKDWLLPILPVLSVSSSTLECHLNEWLKRNQVNCLKSWKGWTIWWGSDEERRRVNEWLKWSVLPKPNLPFKLRFFSSLTTFSFIFTHFICILRIINELLMKMSIEQKEQNPLFPSLVQLITLQPHFPSFHLNGKCIKRFDQGMKRRKREQLVHQAMITYTGN